MALLIKRTIKLPALLSASIFALVRVLTNLFASIAASVKAQLTYERTPQFCGMLYFLLNNIVEHKCPALRAGMKQVTQQKLN